MPAKKSTTIDTKKKKLGKNAKKRLQRKKEKVKLSPSTSKKPELVSSDLIKKSVAALLQIHNEKYANKTLLDSIKVFLQVSLFKIPKVEHVVNKKIALSHSLVPKGGDICLFVFDKHAKDEVARTPDEKIDFSINQYEDLLEKHKVTGITVVMPLSQLCTEYDTFELKRKLVNRCDLFLCDRGLLKLKKFTSSLGRPFIKANKFPLPIRFPAVDAAPDVKFNLNIQKAARSSCYAVKSHSDNYSICFGAISNHSQEELSDNLSSAIEGMLRKNAIPGGVENIKGLRIKTERSLALPLYINIGSGKDVAVPVIEKKVPAGHVGAVEDELSTMPGVKVAVLPGGEVFVTKDGSECSDDSDDGEFDDNETEGKEEVSRKIPSEATKKREKGKKEKKGESESEEEDEKADAAEQEYLADWAKSAEEEKPKPTEKPAVGKKQKFDKKIANKAAGKASKKKKQETKTGKASPKAVKELQNEAKQKKNIDQGKKKKQKSEKANLDSDINRAVGKGLKRTIVEESSKTSKRVKTVKTVQKMEKTPQLKMKK